MNLLHVRTKLQTAFTISLHNQRYFYPKITFMDPIREHKAIVLFPTPQKDYKFFIKMFQLDENLRQTMKKE